MKDRCLKEEKESSRATEIVGKRTWIIRQHIEVYCNHYNVDRSFRGSFFYCFYIFLCGNGLLYQVMRGIGRTAFPIFCFVLVEGLYHTHDVKRYLLRLFAFALVSEIPFDLALSDRILEFGAQNVFFTLFLGLLATALIKCVMEKQGWDMPLKLSLSVLIGIAAIWAAYFLKTDYSGMGILLILIFYVFRSDRVRACIVGYISMMWECLCFPAFICIYFYNGKKGNGNKWFFYLFYPVHLLLLYALRIVIR